MAEQLIINWVETQCIVVDAKCVVVETQCIVTLQPQVFVKPLDMALVPVFLITGHTDAMILVGINN